MPEKLLLRADATELFRLWCYTLFAVWASIAIRLRSDSIGYAGPTTDSNVFYARSDCGTAACRCACCPCHCHGRENDHHNEDSTG